MTFDFVYCVSLWTKSLVGLLFSLLGLWRRSGVIFVVVFVFFGVAVGFVVGVICSGLLGLLS